MQRDDDRQTEAVLALNALKNGIAALRRAPFHTKAAIAEEALQAALDLFTAQQGEIERLSQCVNKMEQQTASAAGSISR